MSSFLSTEQQEIIDLLQHELLDLDQMDKDVFDGDDHAGQQVLLETFSVHLEHLANALDLAGLDALAETCSCLVENFKDLQVNTPVPIDSGLRGQLKAWPKLLIGYLQQVGNPQDLLTATHHLLDAVGDNVWPKHLQNTDRQNLQVRLLDNQLEELEDDATFPTEITAEMTSLQLPADVRQELVDGLIIELPRQVEQFEVSISDYLASHKFEELNQAQRMAHTLKGAANIVGIAAIANLMHFTEDLLELGVKQWQQAPEGFDELLLNASDCLAAMGEYVCGIGPAPEDVEDVMAQVLDWLRGLKQEKNTAASHHSNDVAKIPAQVNLSATVETIVTEAVTVKPVVDETVVNASVANPPVVDIPSETLGIHIDTVNDEGFYLEPDDQKIDLPLDVLDAELSVLMLDGHGQKEHSESQLESCVEALEYDPIDGLCDDDLDFQVLTDEDESSLFDLQALDDDIAEDIPEVIDEIKAEAAAEAEVEVEVKPIIASSEPVLEQKSIPVESVQQEELGEKHFLHLAENTAHELLRLAGESQITNTQVVAQIDSLQSSIQLAEGYHGKISIMAAELEMLVQTQSALRAASKKWGEDEMDPLEMERYSELHSFSHQLLELTTDSHEAVIQIDDQISTLQDLTYQQTLLNRESQTLMLQMRLVPVSTMVSRFNRCVRQASRMTKKVARLEIEGSSTLLDSRVLNTIADPIMHLLRNAVDHGLEASAADRTQKEKKEEGLITLSFRHTGETVTIECRDDGRGLNYEAIKKLAIDKGLISPSDQVDESYLNQLITMPGFSTCVSASQTSGRGIGLDAVVNEVRRLKGKLSVSSSEDKGSCFSITVPTSIISGHAILVPVSSSSEGQFVGVVTRNIEQIVYVQRKELQLDTDNPVFTLDGEPIALVEFSHLTGMRRSADKALSALLIIRRADGERVAVAVQTVIASQEMVIKPLNEFTYHPQGVVGATILGDGAVAAVVDLQELPGMSMSGVEFSRLREQREKVARSEQHYDQESPIALIVDDSLSARRSLAQFVSDIGMEVRTAKDGFEAISVLADKKPALMLVDLEMPRMNGLELTAHLRSREDTRDIPVIMITSRTASKHRIMAENAGVNNYLSKPWSEDELLECIQEQMA